MLESFWSRKEVTPQDVIVCAGSADIGEKRAIKRYGHWTLRLWGQAG
jgi:hypothetical protein